jgi:hypothetical protein
MANGTTKWNECCCSVEALEHWKQVRDDGKTVKYGIQLQQVHLRTGTCMSTGTIPVQIVFTSSV